MFRKNQGKHHSKSILFHLFSLHRGHGKSLIPDFIKKQLTYVANESIENLYMKLASSPNGLTQKVARRRIKKGGLNEIFSEKPPSIFFLLFHNLTNPFVVLLLCLALVSFFLKNINSTWIILSMVALGVTIRFFQEHRSNLAAQKLKSLVTTKATVLRDGKKEDISFKYLVPGDLIYLSAGDMIPADIRLISAHDLFISQSSLTGESTPVEKFIVNSTKETESILDLKNICFFGTNVISGIAKGIVIHTGNRTYFGSIAHAITHKRPLSYFEIGLNKVSLLLIRIMLFMIPVVFFINGFFKGDYFQSLLFSLSVAVGLTPEMFPMIVSTNLSKGAISMAKQKVIVKQIQSIQNFGAMDILCTDKTGTLTEDRVVLEEYLDAKGSPSEDILKKAFLVSYYQTGLKNLLDHAILEHTECLDYAKKIQKIDEIPFDFERKRMSVVVKNNGKKILISKGALDSILSISTSFVEGENAFELVGEKIKEIRALYDQLNQRGLRVLAIAKKEITEEDERIYHLEDERDLGFLGFLVFLDPPKESAMEAISILKEKGVEVKVLTGDDLVITKVVCEKVGINTDNCLIGKELDRLEEPEKRDRISKATIFAKLNPMQKAEIIKHLKLMGHTVGYMGDGINDGPGLREADVGISVDSAVDIAKESSDIIMLEKSLLFLSSGVTEGRKTFANIMKYVKMALSSNFGNVFSIIGSSIFLPFLPMLPIQLLMQNLLYDISQIAIPFDNVDSEYLNKPRKWDAKGIAKFMYFIGPISSIYDYVTFFVLWFIFGASSIAKGSIFQTGWFMEGLLSQTLIVHMIRTEKIPFIQSRPSPFLFFSTLSVISIGLLLPYTWFGKEIQMVEISKNYFICLLTIVIGYAITVQFVKNKYIKRFNSWL
jgi:Mg2+-importing ATPase